MKISREETDRNRKNERKEEMIITIFEYFKEKYRKKSQKYKEELVLNSQSTIRRSRINL